MSDQPPIEELSDLFDRIASEILKKEHQEGIKEMELSGASTEPSSFPYNALVGFYSDAFNTLCDYFSYKSENPSHGEIIKEKGKIISFSISHLVDFHAAWHVLRKENPSLSPEDFKRLDPEERQRMFAETLEKRHDDMPELYTERKKVIDLCVQTGILPADYH